MPNALETQFANQDSAREAYEAALKTLNEHRALMAGGLTGYRAISDLQRFEHKFQLALTAWKKEIAKTSALIG